MKWGSDVSVNQLYQKKKKKKSRFVEFVKFLGVNSPIVPDSSYQVLTTSSQNSWIVNNPGSAHHSNKASERVQRGLAAPPGSDDTWKPSWAPPGVLGLQSWVSSLACFSTVHVSFFFWTLPFPIFIPNQTRNLARIQFLLEPFLPQPSWSTLFSLSYYTDTLCTSLAQAHLVPSTNILMFPEYLSFFF